MYNIDKMLQNDIIMHIDSPFESPLVLCRKNKQVISDDPKARRLVYHIYMLLHNTQYPNSQTYNICDFG